MADTAVQSAASASDASALSPPQQASVDRIRQNATGHGVVSQFTAKAVDLAQKATNTSSLIELAKVDPALAAKIAKIDADTTNAIMKTWSESIRRNAQADRKASERHDKLQTTLTRDNQKQLMQLRVLNVHATRAVQHPPQHSTTPAALTPPSAPSRAVTRAPVQRVASLQPPTRQLSLALR